MSDATMGSLGSQAAPQATDEELLAELRQLRQERQERQAAEEAAAAEEERNRPAPSHYLHLANGEIIESAGTMTHYGPKAIPVIAVAPIEDRSEAS